MLEIIGTEDGSHSLYNLELDQTYHSRHGAIQESEHVFIKHGLRYLMQSPRKYDSLRVLEMGFGTGLNAILTYRFSTQQFIHYTSLDTFPLDMEIVERLNYTKLIQDKTLSEIYLSLHRAEWNRTVNISDSFTLKKLKISLQDFQPESNQFDLVYFDAFAPSKQPELWTLEIMQKMYLALSNGGVFVTYCAKGQLKRDLKTAGFIVETLKGPPGKQEMVRALKL